MSRLSRFGRDVARYLGVGEGSEVMRDYEPKETWLQWAVRLFPPLILALVLRGVLGFEEGVAGFVSTVALLVVLSIAWTLALRTAGAGGRSRDRGGS